MDKGAELAWCDTGWNSAHVIDIELSYFQTLRAKFEFEKEHDSLIELLRWQTLTLALQFLLHNLAF